jgi:phosphoenolpyruvate-protein kinase (PTS system EI component)
MSASRRLALPANHSRSWHSTTNGAVVTDLGGVLSHAVIVAREFGVPPSPAPGTSRTGASPNLSAAFDGDAGGARHCGGRVAP